MSHQMQGMCIKQHQSRSIVNCSVHTVSIRVYTELLKSYSHLIMQSGVALILSDTLRLQTFQPLLHSSAASQSVSVTWRGPQRTAIQRTSVIEIRGHEHASP